MTFFPDYETFATIGNLTVSWNIVTFLFGILVAYESVVAHMREHGYLRSAADELFVVVFTFGVISGRAGWILENYTNYRLYAWAVLELMDGGSDWIAFYYGCLISLLLFAKVKSMSFRRLADVVSIPLLCGFAVMMIMQSMNSVAASTIAIAYSVVILWLFFRYQKYHDGRRRGDLISWLLLFMGMIRMATEYAVNGVISNVSFVLSISAGLLGLLIYMNNRRRGADQPVILFDLDGTLMDSHAMVIDCFRYLFEQHGDVNDFDEEKQMYVFGPPLKTAMQVLFPEEDAEKLVEEYSNYQKEQMGKGTVRLLPKAEKTIRELKKNGYQIGIVSSRMTASCEQWLQVLKVLQLFDVVLGRDAVEHAKPDPEGIYLACEMLESSNDAIIYIGDNPVDVETARNAGAYAVAYVSDLKKEEDLKKEKPNVVIYELWELIGILKSEHEWTYKKI